MEDKKDAKDQQPKTGGLAEDENMIIEASEELEIVKSFDELGLREEL